MASLQDVKFDKLRLAGHTGAINDMMLQWLQAKVPSAETINDGREAWMELALTPDATGQWNTDWFTYLRSLGHTGALNDMELQYWEAL
jgi:hypothetical protein